MSRSPAVLIACILGVAAIALAGCHEPTDDGPGMGDGGPDGGTDGSSASALSFRSHPELGDLLVNEDGRTVYIFTNDEAGTSNCSGGCADVWPPVTADNGTEGPAEIEGELDTIERDDGTMQVTYQERPLYLYAEDTEPGDALGDGRGGVWFVVRRPPADPATLDGRGPLDINTTSVEYHDGVTGHLATPSEDGDHPGVVMIHEWWGLNDNIRNMTELLASHGYRVLAVDLFDGNVANDSDEAQSQVQALDQEEANANLRAAAQHLRDAGAAQIVSLGWCFGGAQALQLALSGETLAGTIIYYGEPVTDEDRLQQIDWPVLGIYGEDDQVISVDDVRAFESALDNVSVENEVYIYPDVGHAFANPSGDNWAAAESQDAWLRTLRWLDENV